MIDALRANEGTSEGAKRGWDKRGRGRKEEPSVAKRFADTSDTPYGKLKSSEKGTSGDLGSRKLNTAFNAGGDPRAIALAEEAYRKAVAAQEVAEAKWKFAQGKPTSGEVYDAYLEATDALSEAEEKMDELKGTELTDAEAKDRSVRSTESFIPKDADLSALADRYTVSTRYAYGGEGSEFDPVTGSRVKGPDKEEAFRLQVVDTAIQQWAHSSADTTVRSLEMQMAVAREFKLGNESRVSERLKVAFDGSLELSPSQSEDRIAALQIVARAMYDSTQAKLKELGIKELTVYRGSSRKEAVNYPVLSNIHISAPAEVSIRGNAASSWSTDVDVAMGFKGESTGDRVPCLFKTVVPRSAVFSTAITGLGCLDEKEVVVLGVGGTASAWKYR